MIVAGGSFIPGRAQDASTINAAPTHDWAAGNPLKIALLKWFSAYHSTSFKVGKSPIGIAFDGTNIWVANGTSPASLVEMTPNGVPTANGLSATTLSGTSPRNIAIDPTGKWLITENQDSGTMFVFRIDQKTGKLTPTGQKVNVPAPVCVVFQ